MPQLRSSVASIECRRLRFPLMATCPLSIHKFQSSMFNQILYHYRMNYKQQLFHAAHSRMTSLEGPSLTIACNTFTFQCAQGPPAISGNEVRNKYLRLANYHLSNHYRPRTTTWRCYCRQWQPSFAIIIINFNSHSLEGHTEDFSTVSLLLRMDERCSFRKL